jgi:hypothetical protein
LSILNNKTKIDGRDISAGALLLVTGGIAAYGAVDFDNESRMFPLVVAILLAVTGAAIAIHAVLKPDSNEASQHKFGSVMLAALIVAAWAVAFANGAGFVLPTFAMQAALIWLTGVRRPFHVLGIAALITALAYLLFVSLLDVPLPPSFLPGVLERF